MNVHRYMCNTREGGGGAVPPSYCAKLKIICELNMGKTPNNRDFSGIKNSGVGGQIGTSVNRGGGGSNMQ